MSTRLHQTWDLGDGELTIDLTHMKPLPAAAYAVLSALASNIQAHADALRMLLDSPADGDTAGGEQ